MLAAGGMGQGPDLGVEGALERRVLGLVVEGCGGTVL